MEDKIAEHYHCCASCRHFVIEKEMSTDMAKGTRQTIQTWCSRLGYETKPNYKFNCWDPKRRVRLAMEKKLNSRCVNE